MTTEPQQLPVSTHRAKGKWKWDCTQLRPPRLPAPCQPLCRGESVPSCHPLAWDTNLSKPAHLQARRIPSVPSGILRNRKRLAGLQLLEAEHLLWKDESKTKLLLSVWILLPRVCLLDQKCAFLQALEGSGVSLDDKELTANGHRLYKYINIF